jgi:hypothetical protein
LVGVVGGAAGVAPSMGIAPADEADGVAAGVGVAPRLSARSVRPPGSMRPSARTCAAAAWKCSIAAARSPSALLAGG